VTKHRITIKLFHCIDGRSRREQTSCWASLARQGGIRLLAPNRPRLSRVVTSTDTRTLCEEGSGARHRRWVLGCGRRKTEADARRGQGHPS
jgi:hypothetical protein